MTYINRFDKRGCYKMDEEATASFLSLASEKGWSYLKATKKEDCEEHFDWKITKNGKEYKVDLKALKRVNSSDTSMTDQLILVELQAVKSFIEDTRPGWIYGKADYICFETNDGFVFVPREKLLSYVETCMPIDQTPRKSNQNKQAHIIYTRKDRNDKFVYLYKHEILPLAEAIWRKYV